VIYCAERHGGLGVFDLRQVIHVPLVSVFNNMCRGQAQYLQRVFIARAANGYMPAGNSQAQFMTDR
jgi:hypothetical protein